MGALGRAYIEVHADTAPFQRDLGPKLRKIIDAIGPDVDKAGNSLGKRLAASTADQVGRDGAKIGRKVKESVEKYVGTHRVKIDVDVDVDRGMFGRFAASIRRTLSGIGSGGGAGGLGMLGGAFGAATTGATSFLKQIGAISMAMSSELLVALLPIVFVLGAQLVGAFISVSAALADLIGLVGLLPGALFVAGAAIGTLILALDGFGDAISAIMSGDPAKIAAALDKLAPSARKVAQEFQATLPWLRQMKQGVQDAFFTRIQGGWMDFVKANGPTISLGLQNIAYSLGNLTRGLLDAASSPAATTFFGNLLISTRKIVDILSGPLSRVMTALTNSANASLPTLERVATIFGGWIDKFALWIEQNIKDGSFQKFLDDALITLGLLKNLTGELLGLLKAIFAETKGGGKTFLEDVTAAIKGLKEFFESEEGKASLRALVDLAQQLANWLKIAAAAAGPILAISTHAANIMSSGGNAKATTGNSKTAKVVSTVLNPFGTFVSGLFGKHAKGGIFDEPTVGMFGEAGKEVIIPMNDPARAASLAQESGLMDMLGGMGGGTTVYVYIGNEPIDSRAMRVVTKANNSTSRALARGPRELV